MNEQGIEDTSDPGIDSQSTVGEVEEESDDVSGFDSANIRCAMHVTVGDWPNGSQMLHRGGRHCHLAFLLDTWLYQHA
jgi:hypothetical protein